MTSLYAVYDIIILGSSSYGCSPVHHDFFRLNSIDAGSKTMNGRMHIENTAIRMKVK